MTLAGAPTQDRADRETMIVNGQGRSSKHLPRPTPPQDAARTTSCRFLRRVLLFELTTLRAILRPRAFCVCVLTSNRGPFQHWGRRYPQLSHFNPFIPLLSDRSRRFSPTNYCIYPNSRGTRSAFSFQDRVGMQLGAETTTIGGECGCMWDGLHLHCAKFWSNQQPISFSQSPWQAEHSMPELPHFCGVEAHSRRAGVRSRQHKVSTTGAAPGSGLHAVSRKTGVYQRGVALRGLPRRHSHAADGGEVRRVPHSQGLEPHPANRAGTRQPIPTGRWTRRAGLRGLPQKRRGGTVPGLVDSVLLMPPDHLSADNCPEPHGRSIGVCCPVRAVSFHQQLVGRQI